MPGLRTATFTAALATAVALAACGGGKEAASTQTGPAKTTSQTQTAQTQTTQTQSGGGIDTMPGASTEPVVVKATNTDTALLTDVRAARHEGFDRVVFQFSNTLPGYDVRYAERPIVQDGSGKEVAVDGAYVVLVRMQNALDADLTKPSAPATYTGPTRFAPGTPELAQLVRSGGFEGVLTWAVGLRDKVDFRVTSLANPPRVVVDFRNH